MDKIDFLYELQQKLAGLPEDDISRSLDYYAEMIDDRIEEGMTEQQAVADLGNIDDIVRLILADIPLKKLVKEKVKPRRTLNAWEIVLLILGSPIWLSLLIAAFAVVLSIYVSLWAVIIALHATGIAVAATAVAGFVCAMILILFGNLPLGLFLLGASLICAGLSILMFFAFNQATRGIIALGKLIFIGIKRCFIRKERKK